MNHYQHQKQRHNVQAIKTAAPLRRRLVGAVLFVALIAVTTMAPASATAEVGSRSEVVVANRGSGSITLIDSRTLETRNVELPGMAEPMYVSHDLRHDQVLVGDRANSTVVAFDDDTYEVIGSVPVGGGVFHQWLENSRRQLWVVGDTSRTVTVVDTRNLAVLTTIDMPADIVEAGGMPHDVFVQGNEAFVTFVGLEEGGVLVQYSTRTFEETGRVDVGGDPHVYVRSGRLFVASQDSSTVAQFRARDLLPLSSAEVEAAHGLFVTTRSEVLVTTISGGGVNAVSELNAGLTTVRDTADTQFPVPHNITVDNRRQMYVTHSGAMAATVSVMALERDGFGEPQTVLTGLNPFGLAFVR